MIIFAAPERFLVKHAGWPGAIAQLVEQRTENPCVVGSIPTGTTFKSKMNPFERRGFFILGRGKKMLALIGNLLNPNRLNGSRLHSQEWAA